MSIYNIKNNLSRYYKWLLFLFIVLSFTSVNAWSSVKFLNSQIERLIQFGTLFLFCLIIIRERTFLKQNYRVISVFIIWALIGIIRGIFTADCYWEYNQLTIGTMSLSLPLLVYVFDKPEFTSSFYKKWLEWCIPAFFIFIFWVAGATQFYLSPIFLLGCFIPLLPKKWKIIIVILLVMMGMSFADRAQIMKVIMCIGLSFAYYFRKIIPNSFLKIGHLLFYIIPIVLLYLGISGIFNFFADGIAASEHQYTITTHGKEQSLNTDTRTFIYKEVINSAVKNDYIMFGRTPALGNDSYYFEKDYNATYKKDIRYMNELCHTNIFTWLGLIGVILYSLIYLKASWLAVYHSNSFALKLIGCYIAFNWLFGWIENTNLYNISNIAQWSIIAMGFSEKFRSFNENEFKQWIKNIFK